MRVFQVLEGETRWRIVFLEVFARRILIISHDNTTDLRAGDAILGEVVLITCFLLGGFFKKSVKTAVPDDVNPSGALVLTKLVE